MVFQTAIEIAYVEQLSLNAVQTFVSAIIRSLKEFINNIYHIFRKRSPKLVILVLKGVYFWRKFPFISYSPFSRQNCYGNVQPIFDFLAQLVLYVLTKKIVVLVTVCYLRKILDPHLLKFGYYLKL